MLQLLQINGLEETDAAARLQQFGPNILDEARSRGIIDILRSTLREPMFLFLLAAAGLYLVIGDLAEGIFLVAGAIVSVAWWSFRKRGANMRCPPCECWPSPSRG